MVWYAINGNKYCCLYLKELSHRKLIRDHIVPALYQAIFI